jgi:hypothetical protein
MQLPRQPGSWGSAYRLPCREVCCNHPVKYRASTVKVQAVASWQWHQGGIAIGTADPVGAGAVQQIAFMPLSARDVLG